MRILVLEDDTKIADFESNGLRQEGYADREFDLLERMSPCGVLAHSVIDGLNAGVRIARDQRRCQVASCG
jgi:hypothetical protein